MSALLLLALLGGAPLGDEVAVLSRPIARGERVTAADFAIEERASGAGRGAVGPADAAGMEAARNLSAGSVVRPADLVRPRLVRRGQPVTIRIVSGSLTITAAGRALSDAASGEPARVVADATSRTLEGVVDGAGTVRIVTP
jgi:flagella basal body P-ring formation protein FlgA